MEVKIRMSDIEDKVTGSDTTTSDFMLIFFEGNFSTTSEPPYFNASLNGTERLEINPFILPWWRQVIWTVLFVCMVIVATGGNLIVIWIVMAHKRMRTVTNYFLVNLSVADAMVSMLNVTFNYTYMLNSDWPFGKTYCKITQFVAVLSICASVFTLMTISIDRYMAIMSPLRHRMGRRTTLIVVLSIWILGSTLSLPMIVFYTTDVVELAEGDVRIVCYSEWPDGPSPHSYYEYLYNVIFMVVTYFLPIGSMTYTYLRVGLELWGSQSIGECTQRQLENIKSKRRVVKMMVVVVLIFVVCWAPFHIYFIVVSLYPQINHSPYIQEVYLGIYWLAMSNSMYNPIIYFWMNSRFRRGFKQFFSCCPFVHVPPETLSRREAVTSRYSYSGSPEAQCRIGRNGGSASMPCRVRSKLNATATCEIAPSHRSSDSTVNCSMRLPLHLGSMETVVGSDSAGPCNYQTFRNGSGTSSGAKRWRGVS